MPACDVYRLQAYVDGQLAPAEARAVVAHLQECETCARLCSELKLTVAPAAPAAVPADLQQRLLQAVAGLQPLPALSCEQALEYVSARADGELPHADCQLLTAHLDACAACARAASEMELTAALLRAVDAEAAPVGLLQRLQRATAVKPARRSTPFVRWAPSFAGVAAAAALIVGLMVHNPQTQTLSPMVSPAPVLRSTTTLPAAPQALKPTAPVTAVAVVPTRATPLAVLKQAAANVTAPVRTTVGHGAATNTVAPPSPAPPRPVTPTAPVAPPPAVVSESTAPVAVALAPSQPEPVVARSVPAPPVPAHTEVATGPTAPSSAMPAPVHVAALETPRPAPVAVATTRVDTGRRRNSWVSRPASEEREIYRAESSETRLAEVRRDLDRDARTIRGAEVKGFIIH